jgi:hypothetical protein
MCARITRSIASYKTFLATSLEDAR